MQCTSPQPGAEQLPTGICRCRDSYSDNHAKIRKLLFIQCFFNFVLNTSGFFAVNVSNLSYFPATLRTRDALHKLLHRIQAAADARLSRRGARQGLASGRAVPAIFGGRNSIRIASDLIRSPKKRDRALSLP
ncbi:hypothetical protein [Burkholderia sp. Ac-20379]|uniref:hypothetical protein n=1 Tax=Burkholderia sp. Ac-20379 TaxID=2703900 RepID=UPI0019821CF3|nr:hypothetical protein [Burkholderia sp. Ac-20379]MBN3725369.1 hypothetical protein [Burkholderia sp. Ac-20379]